MTILIEVWYNIIINLIIKMTFTLLMANEKNQLPYNNYYLSKVTTRTNLLS